MLAAGQVRNCVWRAGAACERIAVVEAEQVIYRDEAAAFMFTVADILEEVRAIRELLENDDGEEEEAVSE